MNSAPESQLDKFNLLHLTMISNVQQNMHYLFVAKHWKQNSRKSKLCPNRAQKRATVFRCREFVIDPMTLKLQSGLDILKM